MWFKVVLLLASVSIATVVQCEPSSRGSDYPACYIDQHSRYMREEKTCANPKYGTCGTGLCCGPDHYCCDNEQGCCRRTSWTNYEATGIVTGAIAWFAILLILTVLIAPRVHRSVRKVLKRK